MEQIGVRELKANLSAYLRRAQDGEEITVTDHGVPVARLAPLFLYSEPSPDAGLSLREPETAYEAETSARPGNTRDRAKPPEEESYASLLKYAQKRGKYKTQKEALTEILREYVQRLRRLELVELFGTIDYFPGHDYKAQRRRK
jgi:prevent-host-death family protein